MANQRLNAIITIGGTVTGSLKSALGSTQKGLQKIGHEIRDLEKKQKALGQQIDAPMGRNVRNLRREYSQLGDEIDKVRKKQERIQQAHDGMGRGKDLISSGAKGVGVVGAIASFGVYPVVQAAKFETAMLGVAKKVDGARDKGGKLTDVYYNLRSEIQKLARELPVTHEELAQIMADGAGQGVAAKHLTAFTRTNAMMATALELPTDKVGENMGKIATLYKMPIPSLGRLGDTINYLDDNAMSTGGDIIEYLVRTGGAASMVNTTGDKMSALGSTLLSFGESTETASTATNAMFGKLAAADKGTKKFREAISEIGLTTKQVQEGMQKDAEGMVLTVMEAVNKMPEGKRLGILTDMFGMEHADTAGKLASGLKEYRRQIALANDPKAVGSVKRENDATHGTAASQWSIFQNRVNEVAISIGDILLPPVIQALGIIGSLTSGIADFLKANEAVVKPIMGVVGALLGVFGVFSLAKIALGGLIVGFWKLVAMATMNPLGLLIAALVVGATLIYQNWEPIEAFFIGLWEGIKYYAGVAWEGMKSAFLDHHPLGYVVKNWGALTKFFGNLFAGIKATIGDAIDWALRKISQVGDTWRAAKSMFGFGDDSGRPAAAPRRAASAPPPMASGRGNRTVQDNSQTTIHVTQPAGANGNAFARALATDNQRRAQGRQNSLLFDKPRG